jgi:hypothetical protein
MIGKLGWLAIGVGGTIAVVVVVVFVAIVSCAEHWETGE